MTEDDQLAELVGAILPRAAGGRSAARLAKRLPTMSADSSFTASGSAGTVTDHVHAALSTLKAEVTRHPGVDGGWLLSGQLGSGHLNLNPTLIAVGIRGLPTGSRSRVSIRAAAKEGLINQHSAQKAIDRLQALLTDIVAD